MVRGGGEDGKRGSPRVCRPSGSGGSGRHHRSDEAGDEGRARGGRELGWLSLPARSPVQRAMLEVDTPHPALRRLALQPERRNAHPR
jgi:hypothetical protein